MTEPGPQPALSIHQQAGAALAVIVGAGAAASALGPGPARAALAVLLLATAAAAAWTLRGVLQPGVLLAATIALRVAFDGQWGPTALAGLALYLHTLSDYVFAPLAVHVVAAAWDEESEPVPLYAPLAAAALLLLVGGAGAATAAAAASSARLARLAYALWYALLLLRVLRRRLTARAATPREVESTPKAATLAREGRYGAAGRLYAGEGSFLEAAEMARKAGDWAQAGECYRRARRPYEAAEAFYRAERLDEATDLYEEAGAFTAAAQVAERTDLERAVTLYERAGEPAEAVRILEEAGRRPTGDLFYAAGDAEEAVVAWQEEGQLLRAAEVLEQEFRDLEGAAQVLSNAAEWERAARLFETAAQRERAVDAYRRAGPLAAVEAARLRLEDGDAAGATEILDGLDPGTTENMDEPKGLIMARVFERGGRVDEAVRVLQQLRRAPEPGGPVYFLLGRCLRSKGLGELAEEHLRVAARLPLPPDEELEARYLLGCVLEELGRPEDAIEIFAGILDRDLSYRDVESRYRALRDASADRSGGGAVPRARSIHP